MKGFRWLASLLFGVVVTVMAFPVYLVFSRVADAMLNPGYYFPESYWGGVHDPLQLLLALFLNVCFFAFWGYLAVLVWIGWFAQRK